MVSKSALIIFRVLQVRKTSHMSSSLHPEGLTPPCSPAMESEDLLLLLLLLCLASLTAFLPFCPGSARVDSSGMAGIYT